MEVEDNAYLTQTPKWDSICSITKYSAVALCLRFFLLFSLPKAVSRLLEKSAATIDIFGRDVAPKSLPLLFVA